MKKIKIFIYPLLYWVVFIGIPALFMFLFKNNTFFDTGYVLFYLLFFAPFLFIVPYKLSHLTTKQQKIKFIIFGLVLPYLIIYLYVIYNFIYFIPPHF